MERLRCKTCGARAMVPMEVTLPDADDELVEVLGEEPESRFYTCHVCGDNWLSVKENEIDGQCRVIFVHQMGMEPVLKRIAHMQTPVVLTENSVDHWSYYFDDLEIDREIWLDKLTERRKILRSICTN